MTTELRIEVSDEHNASATPDANGQYPVQIIRKSLRTGELGTSDDYRFNPVTGDFEFYSVVDDSWVPANPVDPRFATVFPPLTGTDAHCDSAHSIRWWLENRYVPLALTLLNGLSSVAGIAAAIVGFITEFIHIPYGYFIAIAIELAQGLVDAGAGNIATAMTSGVYDDLECLLFCRMGGAGQLDGAGFSGLIADIADTFSGDAETILSAIVGLAGLSGLNGLASQGFDRGNCASCGSCAGWCYSFDFTADDGGFTLGGAYSPTNQQQGQWVSGTGWQHTTTASGNARRRGVYITRRIDATVITKVSMRYTYSAGAANTWENGYGTWSINLEGDSVAGAVYPTLPGASPKEWTGSIDSTLLGLSLMCCVHGPGLNTGSGGTCVITGVTFEGTGNNPFGTDNC